MNNDLISRSALTKELRERLVACNDWEEKAKDKETRIRANAVKTFICEMFLLLKEFPTVDTFTFDDMKKGINVGYKAGRLSEKWERPKGDCQNYDFRKFSETFINGIVEVMTKNGIESVEQLSEILGKGKDND